MTTGEIGILREQAVELRRQAFALLHDGGFLHLVRDHIGPTEVVGSVDLDLMVYPDIDLYARLPSPEAGRLVELIPAVHERLAALGFTVVRTVLNDEYRRPTDVGEGYYAGYQFQPGAAGHREWKVDLWAWAPERYEERLATHRALAAHLAGAERDLVLRLKEAVSRRPDYRRGVNSMDVYAFVFSGSGSTVEDFDASLASRRASQSP